MKSEFLEQFLSGVEEAGHAVMRWTRRGTRAIARMNGPQLLVTAVALAIALTIIPLAIVLFVSFLLIKLVVTAFFVSKRRKLLPPPAPREN
jgi:hypothetical protein